jgi:hypothetical protein
MPVQVHDEAAMRAMDVQCGVIKEKAPKKVVSQPTMFPQMRFRKPAASRPRRSIRVLPPVVDLACAPTGRVFTEYRSAARSILFSLISERLRGVECRQPFLDRLFASDDLRYILADTLLPEIQNKAVVALLTVATHYAQARLEVGKRPTQVEDDEPGVSESGARPRGSARRGPDDDASDGRRPSEVPGHREEVDPGGAADVGDGDRAAD